MQQSVLVRLSTWGFALLLLFSLDGSVLSQESVGESIDEFASAAEIEDGIPEMIKPTEFGAGDIVAAETMVQSLHVADWLGPLAPVALSPFFGLACLSGLSIWGPDWLSGNALLSAAGPLQNKVIFGIFLVLTVMTSVPRLTKVSKPFAQAMDQIETYSVILILLMIKLFADVGNEAPGQQVAMVQFGIFSFTAQTLLALAMVINLFVINSVKFFFEFLIWLTPVPAVDAMFEIVNKAVCAALMALYAFSPTMATLINLVILLAALIVFRWAYRRMIFYRRMLIDLFLPRLWKSYGIPKHPTVIGFVKQGPSPFDSSTRWKLSRKGDSWEACKLGLFGSRPLELEPLGKPTLRRGWTNHLLEFKVSNENLIQFHVSRRYDGFMDEWLELCGIEADTDEEMSSEQIHGVRAEFS